MLYQGGSSGRAPLIMYSQATVRSQRGNVHRGLQAPWNHTSLSQDHRTRHPLVDKGNSVQSTRTLSCVCTISEERHNGVWQEAGATALAYVSECPYLDPSGWESPCALADDT